MTALWNALAVLGCVTVVALLALSALCVVMARRGRQALRYRDEMQEQRS